MEKFHARANPPGNTFEVQSSASVPLVIRGTSLMQLAPEATVEVAGWPGFRVVVPKGTTMKRVHWFAGALLDGTARML